MENEFLRAYRELDCRMRDLAELDGDVYLPNPEPTGPVNYIFVCMEPSLGHWAQSSEEARTRVASGFRNFLVGVEPMLLHFSARRFLCDDGERYHITDFSKGAMLVAHASQDRPNRYSNWYRLLKEELDLLAAPGARIIAVGKAVADHLRQHQYHRPVTSVIHYSPLASRTRNVRLQGHEDRFRKFASSISSQDILASARAVLGESRVPQEIYDEALSIVARSQLSESRLKLVYCYKLDFEALKA